ncbi:SRPBCC family protein [Marinomonas gallaica]|uniref:hypothetical protein n=1 Tax=Marinomonas gallaica TaxID=1806667 RepID=UPI000833A7D7|nr:hypothetical protein [Marinomonas gallaica]
MTASNSPFSLQADVLLPIPSLMAWDLLTSPTQYQWNRALQKFEASLGFHTGSKLQLTLQSLRGPLSLVAEVVESTPGKLLTFESSFRCLFCRHHENWSFTFIEESSSAVCLTIRYSLSGAFAARVWDEKKLIVNNILNLWLESIKQQAKRM